MTVVGEKIGGVNIRFHGLLPTHAIFEEGAHALFEPPPIYKVKTWCTFGFRVYNPILIIRPNNSANILIRCRGEQKKILKISPTPPSPPN